MNKLFKILSAVTISLTLIACGDSKHNDEPVVLLPVPIVVVEEAPEEVPVLVPCSATVTSNCQIVYCPQGIESCTTTPPEPCKPEDTKCRVLFCQPNGYCPLHENQPANHVPVVPILNIVCENNPENGCPSGSTKYTSIEGYYPVLEPVAQAV